MLTSKNTISPLQSISRGLKFVCFGHRIGTMVENRWGVNDFTLEPTHKLNQHTDIFNQYF